MWLHIPGIALAAAQESADWTSQSNSRPRAEPALFVTSSEKAMRRRLSWHGWRRRHWLKFLAGDDWYERSQGLSEKSRRSMREMQGTDNVRDGLPSHEASRVGTVLPTVPESTKERCGSAASGEASTKESRLSKKSARESNSRLRREVPMLRGDDTGIPGSGPRKRRGKQTPERTGLQHTSRDQPSSDQTELSTGVSTTLPQLQLRKGVVREVSSSEPLMPSAPVQESADLTSQSNSPCLTREPSATSSANLMQPQSLSPECSKGYSTKPRYGTVLNPLMADRGADLWISSLRAFRVSQLPLLVIAKGQKTKGGGGRTLQGYFARYDRHSHCWRTSQGSLLSTAGEPLPKFLEAWPNSGTGLNGACFQRRRWVPRIDVKDSSSWPTPTSQDSGGNKSASVGAKYRPSLRRINGLWQSPKAGDARSAGVRANGNPHGGNKSLTSDAHNWPTPTAEDSQDSGARIQGGQTLAQVGKLWQTPQAADAMGPGNQPRLKMDRDRDPDADGSYRQDLKDQVNFWQTPQTDSFRSRGGDRKNEQGLDQQARLFWSTPRAADAHGSGYQRDHGMKGRERLSLSGEAKMFPSPQARDYRDGRSNRVDLTHSPDLNTVIEPYLTPLTGSNSLSSRQDQANVMLGDKLSTLRPRLNRLFVEWLMNWPIGWTSFELSVMEYFRWRRQSRYMFLVLVSE